MLRQILLMAAEGHGPIMHAQIAMLHHGEPNPQPREKRARRFRIIS
jgi:hypothetical protein